MNKLNTLSLALAGVLALVGFSGCKKDDTTAPVVTLVGASPFSVVLGGSFVDPGATALDDVDGDLTDGITVAGSVNVNNSGTYTLTYTAADAAGNTGSVSRDVVVSPTRDSYVGTFSCTETCPSPYGLSSNSTFSTGPGANQITISPFYFNGGSLTFTVDGSNVTIDAGQSPQPMGETVTGNGTLNPAGSVLSMNLTITPSAGSPTSCVATYTKQ